MKNESIEFKEACANVGIPVTSRQASKWSMKKGLAYKVKHGLLPNPNKKKCPTT